MATYMAILLFIIAQFLAYRFGRKRGKDEAVRDGFSRFNTHCSKCEKFLL